MDISIQLKINGVSLASTHIELNPLEEVIVAQLEKRTGQTRAVQTVTGHYENGELTITFSILGFQFKPKSVDLVPDDKQWVETIASYLGPENLTIELDEAVEAA